MEFKQSFILTRFVEELRTRAKYERVLISEKTAIVSSTYCRTWTFPMVIPFVAACQRTAIARVSTATANRYGEIGSFCLTPLTRVK